jgi:hypothetical protein
MPIRGSPNGARHPRPQAGRDRPECVVAINRNAWSRSIGIAGRDHSVCAWRNALDCPKGFLPHSSSASRFHGGRRRVGPMPARLRLMSSISGRTIIEAI